MRNDEARELEAAQLRLEGVAPELLHAEATQGDVNLLVVHQMHGRGRFDRDKAKKLQAEKYEETLQRLISEEIAKIADLKAELERQKRAVP